MKLLIVESPAKAKTIGKYLGAGYKVISSYGHVRALPSEQNAVDPDHNFAMHYQVIPKAKKRIDEIVQSAKSADTVLLATDPDREGEAISWHIQQVLLERKTVAKTVPIKRVVFHEITKKAISEAVNNPRDLNINLVHAQQARQALDYLVGFTLSPVLWRKLPGSRSAGRVQSVALRMICERENEIENFLSQEYWSIHAQCRNSSQQPFTATLHSLHGEKLQKFSLSNEEQARDAQQQLKNLSWQIAKLENKITNRKPSPPFTTSTMLQEASRKLGFSAKKTSQLAQKLYEGVSIDGEVLGLITYMRTDSVSLSAEATSKAADFIKGAYGASYLPSSPNIYRTKAKNAQEAHEAIRPTDVKLTPEAVARHLEADMLRLYELIWKRMVASQMAEAKISLTSADIADANHIAILRATGSTIVFDGFLKLYRESNDDKEDEAETILPLLQMGESITISQIEGKQHFTQPPPRYSEASLVKCMEELGIGRPSTYPTIISILQDREYANLDRKRFVPQVKGRIVNAFLTSFFKRYMEYSFTADLENELDNISNGGENMLQLLARFWQPFKTLTQEVLALRNQDITPELEKSLISLLFPGAAAGDQHNCPNCQTGILSLKTGKFGAFIGCSNYPTCNYIKPLTKETDNATNSDEYAGLPKTLGNDPSHNEEISLCKGPYGLYVQRGEGKKVKRASLPKGSTTVDLATAIKLLNMPLLLGENPDNQKPIKVGIGRFGPYLECDGKYTSLKQHDPMTIELTEAIALIRSAAAKSSTRKPVYTKKK